MSNPFYSAMRGGNTNMMSMLQQLKSNPMRFLAQKRFNIPANIANDPNAILQHLVNSGQVSQNQVNAAYQQGQRFKSM